MIQSCIIDKCLKYPICKSLEFIECLDLAISITNLKDEQAIEIVHWQLLTHFPNLLQIKAVKLDEDTTRYIIYDINHPHKGDKKNHEKLLMSLITSNPFNHNKAKVEERKHFYYKDQDRALTDEPPLALMSDCIQVVDKNNIAQEPSARTYLSPPWYAARFKTR